MNQQIQQFKIECLEWNEEDQVWQVNAEKFAELIVNQCADICEDEDDGSIDTKSVRLAMIRMKKHFGVE
jgi:hypothetical protein